MMQRQQKRQNEKEDWISRLPDEILIQILSLLTVQQAQMTSVLSTRWRYLWTRITCLNFSNIGYLERSERINLVNKVCSSIQSPRIENFRMLSKIDGKKVKDNIDKSVDFAMEKGVKNLELVIFRIPRKSSTHYIFSCPATVSSGIINKHLRSLNLRYINVSGETLEQFLLHCQSLEQITIHYSTHLKTLNVGVGGPLLNLKSLEIFNCFNLTDLKISAPKLSNFQYQGQQISLHVENAPLLCHVYIGGHLGDCLTWAFRALSSYVCQLQTLVLCLEFYECFYRPVVFSYLTKHLLCRLAIPSVLTYLYVIVYQRHMDFQLSWKLSSLRELTVKGFGRDCESLLFILSFLKVTPFLEKLRLENKLKESTKLLNEKTDAVCSHKHLKVLEIIRFNASPNLIKFVKHLCGAAPKLEKVVIDPSPPRKAFATKCSQIVFVKNFTKLSEKLLKSVISQTDFVLEIMD